MVAAARAGNGAMDLLVSEGRFEPPTLASLEDTFDYGLSLRRGRVFVDLWDVGRIVADARNSTERAERLARMNLSQRIEPRVR